MFIAKAAQCHAKANSALDFIFIFSYDFCNKSIYHNSCCLCYTSLLTWSRWECLDDCFLRQPSWVSRTLNSSISAKNLQLLATLYKAKYAGNPAQCQEFLLQCSLNLLSSQVITVTTRPEYGSMEANPFHHLFKCFTTS